MGGARTALFNFLFARSQGGTFILRIEDTDQERSTAQAVDAIFQGMEWLKLAADEGPFYQSERFSLYQEYAKRLLSSGHAYRCTCTTERLNALREQQRQANQTPKYDGLHRPAEFIAQDAALPLGGEAEPFVIRLRTPVGGSTVFRDSILDEISTPNDEIDDFIIIRSDGTPTYNFTVVVDDIEMRITHIIRGMDHVSNTPKQLAIYHALKAQPPVFAHVPMILGPDKKKLSKRHGATSVIEYKKMGYLSDAFVNYLARLGWSHGDQEIFSRAELQTVFSLEHVGKSPAVFDLTKLQWVNAEHLKSIDIKELKHLIVEMLEADGWKANPHFGEAGFSLLLNNLRERSKTLCDMAEACKWFLAADEELQIDEKAAKKHLVAERRAALASLVEELKSLNSFDETELETAFQRVIEQGAVSLSNLAQPTRVALTGSTVSPPIYAVLEILGKERSLHRLQKALGLMAA